MAQLAVADTAVSELDAVNAELKEARAHRRQLERHITALERRRKTLRSGRPKAARARPRKPRPSRTLDPHSQAGPKNVALMADTFRRLGTASAAEATKAAGAEPGHQVWAIRALVADGTIEDTGEKVGVSKVYRYRGRRRVTRLAPGK
jgi:hypothetical protein